MHIRWCPDTNFQKVSHRVHCFDQPCLCRSLRPQERLGIRLRKNARRTNQVPRRECEACVSMVLLSSDVLMDTRQGPIRREIHKKDSRSNEWTMQGPEDSPFCRTRSTRLTGTHWARIPALLPGRAAPQRTRSRRRGRCRSRARGGVRAHGAREGTRPLRARRSV